MAPRWLATVGGRGLARRHRAAAELEGDVLHQGCEERVLFEGEVEARDAAVRAAVGAGVFF